MPSRVRTYRLAFAAVACGLLLAACSGTSAESESAANVPATVAQQPSTSDLQGGAEQAEGSGEREGGEQGEDGEREFGEEGEGGEGGGALTAPSGAGSTATYTMADVAQHSSPADCWSAIDGGVFDLTAWIPQHPGGSEVVAAMCGIDGSPSFNGQHGGQGEPAQVLAQLQVGVLAG